MEAEAEAEAEAIIQLTVRSQRSERPGCRSGCQATAKAGPLKPAAVRNILGQSNLSTSCALPPALSNLTLLSPSQPAPPLHLYPDLIDRFPNCSARILPTGYERDLPSSAVSLAARPHCPTHPNRRDRPRLSPRTPFRRRQTHPARVAPPALISLYDEPCRQLSRSETRKSIPSLSLSTFPPPRTTSTISLLTSGPHFTPQSASSAVCLPALDPYIVAAPDSSSLHGPCHNPTIDRAEATKDPPHRRDPLSLPVARLHAHTPHPHEPATIDPIELTHCKLDIRHIAMLSSATNNGFSTHDGENRERQKSRFSSPTAITVIG